MSSFVFRRLFICFSYIFCLHSIKAQNSDDFIFRFVNESESLDFSNQIISLQNKDFSTIWMQTNNNYVYGIIGKEHQRLRMRFTEIQKSDMPNIYLVTGKSMVDNTICDFKGKIIIQKIYQYSSVQKGLDNEDLSDHVKERGILIADYSFEEDSLQSHSGHFSGKLYSRWYLDENNQVRYDDIDNYSDGYTNNNYVGIWTSYNSGKTKICNWGDYRVPMCNNDFDMGAAEFFVSEKYRDKGWEEFTEDNSQIYQDTEIHWWE